MKFMVSCRQPLTILKEVEEIRVNYEDIERLKDFVSNDWVCSADIVIYIPNNQLIKWEEIDSYKDVLNITLAVENSNQISSIKEKKGYKIFWEYPVSTYQELNSVLSLGVDQVLIDGSLYFNLLRVKSICGENVELRIVVNKCFNNNLPLKNGICGTYVRPEDIEVYSKFVSHFEFDADNSLKKEYNLYNIYAKNKAWPGNLNFLLTNLNIDVDNRGFDLLPFEENNEDNKIFAKRRLSCRQICQEKSSCNFCPQVFNLINTLQSNVEKQQMKDS